MTFWVKLDIDEINKKTISNHSIILDIDENIIHSFENISDIQKYGLFDEPELRRRIYILDLNDVVSKKGAGKHEKMYFIARPYLEEFLVFCFRYFKTVTVWSAGKRRYVREITKKIFSHIEEPHVVFTYDECLDENNECNNKPLTKLYSKFPNTMNEKNTFILDDRIHNFDPNPDNGILTPPYLPVSDAGIKKGDYSVPDKNKMLNDKDNCLKLVMDWFMRPEVINSKDIRTLDKSHIFPPELYIPNY